MLRSELIGKEKKIGKIKEKAIKVTREDGKMMDPADVREFVENLIAGADQKFKEYKMMIRGLNVTGWWTLKSFQQDELNLQELDEYLDGKVKSDSKFGKLYQMQVFISYTLK